MGEETVIPCGGDGRTYTEYVECARLSRRSSWSCTTRSSTTRPAQHQHRDPAANLGYFCLACGQATEAPECRGLGCRTWAFNGLLSMPERLAEGTVIAGKYSIEETIGYGGMGIVFAATHVDSKRPVAIKLIRSSAAAEPFAFFHFLREGYVASRVRHPRVAAIYDVGVDQKLRTPFIAMERIGGRTLRKALNDDGPFEPIRAYQICVSIADGLAACHARGVVHRDIKPENIIVTAERDRCGDVRLIDFGVACLVSGERPSAGQSPMLIGTLPYMSPEQVAGEHLDHRSDLFALGCVLHEMLTGYPPFRSLGDIIRWSTGSPSIAEPPTLSFQHRTQLNDALLRTHASLLQPDASVRASSAREVIDTLTTFTT